MKDEITVMFAKMDNFEFCRRMEVDHITSEKLEYLIKQKEIIVACIDNIPVGYLRIEYLWHIIPYIGLILVDKNHRKIGVGKSLLAFVENHLKSNGYPMIYSSSEVSQPEPQQWHRHVGFEECGIIDRINQGDIGEIFFRKHII